MTVSMKYLWVIRHRKTKEPVMLVRSEYPVPPNHVLNKVYIALYPDKEFIRNVLYTDVTWNDGFTPAEWTTWLAFGIAPAIEIYTNDIAYFTADFTVVWDWKRVTA